MKVPKEQLLMKEKYFLDMLQLLAHSSVCMPFSTVQQKPPNSRVKAVHARGKN